MTYTPDDVDKMREIALKVALNISAEHKIITDEEDKMLALLRYAEDIAQTYIQANITPNEFEECYKEQLRR